MAALHPDPAFDRELRRSLAVVNRGAAAVGDVLDVARRVRTGDIGGWEREWQRTADLALARGDDLNGGDDLDGACRAFLQAAEYYRKAGIFSDGESRRALDMSHVNAFRAAMPLLPVAAEIVEITDAASDGSGSQRLRGYLFRVAAGTGRPLVLATVGADSTAEAGYPLVAMPVIERGMNCLILDCSSDRPTRHSATACWRRALPAARYPRADESRSTHRPPTRPAASGIAGASARTARARRRWRRSTAASAPGGCRRCAGN